MVPSCHGKKTDPSQTHHCRAELDTPLCDPVLLFNGSANHVKAEQQAWRTQMSDTCRKCATAPFDHSILARWLDTIKDKLPNVPKQFITQSNKNEDRTLLAELKKHGIEGVCTFSTFVYEHGCPENEVFPPCRNCQGLVKDHWKTDREPYCSDTCVHPPCADGCGAQRPQGQGAGKYLFHNWECTGKAPWTTRVRKTTTSMKRPKITSDDEDDDADDADEDDDNDDDDDDDDDDMMMR